MYSKEIIPEEIVDLIAKRKKEPAFNDQRKITNKKPFYEDIVHRYTE